MSLTAEQANKNPDLLSRNRDKPSICRTYLDGTMGAILFEGKAFITTPNGDNVYEPVLGLTTTVRLRQDGRFGAEDPFQLPQQYVREHSHLACIRRPPTRREDTNDVMFMNPVYEDHFRSSHQSRIGLLDQRLVSRIREPSVLLVKRYYAFIESRPDLSQNRRFHGHATQLKIWIGRLESTKASWPDILFSFTQAQRHFLELEAYLEYMQVRQPLMNSDEYGRILSPTANFVGAVTNKVVIVEEFAKAGIPVWLIRPIREFHEDTRIDTVITPTPAEAMNIELRPWRGHKTNVWNQDAADPQRHNNLMLFGREFLAYTDFGRTSVVRDTIERPPPVPSFGHDYSAGPARAPRAHNEPQHDPKPRIQLSPTDVLHFRPNLHRFMPIMMESWVHGLSTVAVTKKYISPQYKEGANGFIFPPPTTFVPLNSDADLKPRQLKILHAYITHLDVLLLRMSPRLSPTLISRKRWDLLLGPERSQPHATPVAGPSSRDTHSSQPAPKKMKLDNNYLRRQCMQGLLAKWTAEYDKDHQNRNEDLNWRSEVIPSDRWPHDRITERIMYEVIETNFRWELRMLDGQMLAGEVDHIAHDDLLNQCFPSQSFEGEGGGDHMNVTYLTAWSGLSNPNDLERRKYVLAISRVMVDWRDCPGGIVDALRQEESDVDYVELEKTCASYYCRSFFHHFARAPSVPHRTKIDPSIYIMP
ncbi:hypothetical protein PC9H_008278 [Pleurotus ostreatus]|uniref:Uncharacterized protein n=1 Tax=Pleurotus ostreatus TaxID=5322 RepID=A0A8H6ZSD2_PLEOS|nr:uncharacterized protein PC9H_008278 [Pleurotus ostreatus]KAF7425916.1 hypothetical protein PC9H_008278 [Pleurotus ostreatus]